MHRRANRIFWMSFSAFSVYAVLVMRFSRDPVAPEFAYADAVISAVSVLLCGVVMRYWFGKNQDKFKR